MGRTMIAVVGWLAVAGVVDTARAVWVDETVHHIRRGYRYNEKWPWPYVCADRVAVREPFCVMVNNGWRRQNLLGAHYFDAETNELTTAGRLRIHWIMTQAPPERRTIFVERAFEPEVTQQRMAIIQQYTAQLAHAGQPPQILETHLVSEGRPASMVDATNVRFHESMPPPRLPAATASSPAGP